MFIEPGKDSRFLKIRDADQFFKAVFPKFQQNVHLNALEYQNIQLLAFISDNENDQPNPLATRIVCGLEHLCPISKRQIRGPAVVYIADADLTPEIWESAMNLLTAKDQKNPPPELKKYLKKKATDVFRTTGIWRKRGLTVLPSLEEFGMPL